MVLYGRRYGMVFLCCDTGTVNASHMIYPE